MLQKRVITIIVIFLMCLSSCKKSENANSVPVILITDLYFPGQDVGDNFDILTPYSLNEIDLKAVVFDITEDFRKISSGGRGLSENTIIREPGFIVIQQLNYLFDKDVSCGCSPFTRLTFVGDTKLEASEYETKGINLLFDVLEKSNRPVHIVSTGSCRPLAVAYNRNPKLMTSNKVAAVHIAAGASSDSFLEWNIALDTLAAATVLKSNMNLAIYPCATKDGPFARDENNTFWSLRDLDFILDMEPALRNYLVYQVLSINRLDYLNFLESPLEAKYIQALQERSVDKWYGSGGRHYVWETALWQQVAGLKLVATSDTTASLIKEELIIPSDVVFEEELKYVNLDVKENGLFSFTYSDKPTTKRIYYRSDPWENERLLNLALPELYKSYKIN